MDWNSNRSTIYLSKNYMKLYAFLFHNKIIRCKKRGTLFFVDTQTTDMNSDRHALNMLNQFEYVSFFMAR